MISFVVHLLTLESSISLNNLELAYSMLINLTNLLQILMKTSNLWPSCHWITRCRSLSNWLWSQHWRHSVSIWARKIVLLVVWCTRSKGIGRRKTMLHNRLFLWSIIPLKSERIVKKETLKRKRQISYNIAWCWRASTSQCSQCIAIV